MQWLGAACVLGATGGAGWTAARRLTRRPGELAALQSALAALRTEVEYGRTPLPAALGRAAQGAPPAVARLFATGAELLAAGHGWSPAEAWAAALAEAEPLSAWTAEDAAALGHLGDALGASGAEDQVRHIELCASRLAANEARARAGLERRARMCLYLGVLAGLAVVLTAI